MKSKVYSVVFTGQSNSTVYRASRFPSPEASLLVSSFQALCCLFLMKIQLNVRGHFHIRPAILHNLNCSNLISSIHNILILFLFTDKSMSLVFNSVIVFLLGEEKKKKDDPTLALRKDGYLLKALASMSSLTSLPRSPQKIRKSSATWRDNSADVTHEKLKSPWLLKHTYLL